MVSLLSLRRCRNWQTSKTKDLVPAMACGFKSHSPHTAAVAKQPPFHLKLHTGRGGGTADAHGSGPCASDGVRVQIPFSAFWKDLGKTEVFLYFKPFYACS